MLFEDAPVSVATCFVLSFLGVPNDGIFHDHDDPHAPCAALLIVFLRADHGLLSDCIEACGGL